MRLLLIKNDTKIASFVIKGMEEAGFAADHAADGEEGLYMALNGSYLVDNAIKYTPKAGHIYLEARQTSGKSIITIKDTGIGISPQELPRIWDRLYRGDQK